MGASWQTPYVLMKALLRIAGIWWVVTFLLAMAYLFGVALPGLLAGYGAAAFSAIEWLLMRPMVFIPLFIVFMLFTMWMLAERLGWRDLATVYGAPVGRAKTPMHSVSGTLGGMGFSRAIQIGGDAHSLRLRGVLPFRFVFPSLSISWEEVELSRETESSWKTLGQTVPYVRIRLANRPDADLRIIASDFERSSVGHRLQA
ncbi:MAG: hypothetical protein Rubg2KO_31370 [Rubricoccaceae bacterium]